MRLLHARTHKFEVFPFIWFRPPYAILSHTWGKNEVTHQQFLDPMLDHHGQGYYKIEAACREALKYGLDYIWIDNICVDKTNYAELSEAIKSMFLWYHNSRVCFAYLADFRTSSDALSHDLSKCRWFTRGWILQELLAPKSMVFFDSMWTEIGTRDDLADQISEITSINQVYLCGKDNAQTLLQEASIAERMSWASRRKTTKDEDMAYCLIGIFDVSIPLMYGEGGAMAFQRLQMEIAMHRFDPTLLAWDFIHEPPMDGYTEPLDAPSYSPWKSACATLFGFQHPWYIGNMYDSEQQRPQSLLASSPASFRRAKTWDFLPIKKEWRVSANQLRISLPKSLDKIPYIVLPCYARNKPDKLLAIPISAHLSGSGRNVYGRATGRLRLVDAITWDQWPHESIALDLGSRNVLASKQSVPYILCSPELPEGLRYAKFTINEKQQPYASTIKIKASQVIKNSVHISFSIHDASSNQTSELNIRVSPSLERFRDLPPTIEKIVQTCTSPARVKCIYSSQATPRLYVPHIRQRKVLGSTMITIELERSPGMPPNIAIRLLDSLCSRMPPWMAKVWKWICGILSTILLLSAARILTLWFTTQLLNKLIYYLSWRCEQNPEHVSNAFWSNYSEGTDDPSFLRFSGFMFFRRCLISALFLLPEQSAFLHRHFWIITLLRYLGPIPFSRYFREAYQSPSLLHLAALAGYITNITVFSFAYPLGRMTLRESYLIYPFLSSITLYASFGKDLHTADLLRGDMGGSLSLLNKCDQFLFVPVSSHLGKAICITVPLDFTLLLRYKFQRSHRVEDLEAIIFYQRRFVGTTTGIDLDRSERVASLSPALGKHCYRTNSLQSLLDAVCHGREALARLLKNELSLPRFAIKGSWGKLLGRLFHSFGEPNTLREEISMLQSASIDTKLASGSIVSDDRRVAENEHTKQHRQEEERKEGAREIVSSNDEDEKDKSPRL